MARCSPLVLLTITPFILTVIILSCVMVQHSCHGATTTRGQDSSLDFPRSECLQRCHKEAMDDEACYKNCMESLQTGTRPKKRKKRASSGIELQDKVNSCPLDTNTTKVRIGNISNLMITFQRRYNNQNIPVWTANISWDVHFSDLSLKWSDIWQGFLVYWSASNEAIATPYCRFNKKNMTWIAIENGTNGWLYPDAIETYVMFYPSHEDDGAVYMQRFSPPTSKVSAVSSTNKPPTLGLRWVAIGVGVFAGLVILAITLGLYKKMRRSSSADINGQQEYEYDTSILFSSQDEDFVIKTLIPFLEKKNNFKCFVHYRNWEPGKFLHENMAYSVYNCRKIIAVISRHFLESNYCQDELGMALERVHRCGDSSLIVINLDGVPLEALPQALRSRTFLDLTSSVEKKTWKGRLYRQISADEEKQNSVPSGVKIISTKKRSDVDDTCSDSASSSETYTEILG